ncbi:hypothetical protein PFICI_07795 [Pestalotiopsis fici W106-1]|uniref:Uncharacterized protein n=1 Tax=Pestalotiopsis fici (strain W106-1 / CGMCC3.15140) TaxID=1229662 RepID=W3X525_PESFW|nr:uncharacterized protein PFICI_07795 [Pestalotiopsis fici W106-1]ETS80266.1 hypothetical protein PFICI_07795 [Pestalotiopsis fici W106-1]
MWEFRVNLANGVKESKYPVWTRANNYKSSDAKGVEYNELMRANGGTSLDYIGLDPYLSDLDGLYAYGHKTISTSGTQVNAWGKNLVMAMENGGDITNAPNAVLATLAGGALYNTYEIYGPDGYGLYVPTSDSDFTPVARGSYVADVKVVNNMLKKIGHDLASRVPLSVGGTGIAFYNYLASDTTSTSNFQAFNVTYETTNTTGVGISTVRTGTELAFVSSQDATFTLSSASAYNVVSAETGSYNGGTTWSKDETATYNSKDGDVDFSIAAGECIRIVFEETVAT